MSKAVLIRPGMRLLERERELGCARRALDSARGGSGSVVLVEAAAGLGKTSLLARPRWSATSLMAS
jgi:hypothetical protein